MKISNYIFENKQKDLNELYGKVRYELKNRNDFPRSLPLYYKKSNVISRLLEEIFLIYETNRKNINEELKIEDFDSLCPYFDNESINVFFGILINDLHDDYYDLSSYIDLPTKDLPIYKETDLEFDDEGLVEIDEKFSFQQNSILYENKHVIYCSPFFRRSYRAKFPSAILNISKFSKKAKTKILLDHYHFLEQNSHINQSCEFDHWWGKKFSQDKLNDKNYTGILVYGRKNENNYDVDNARSPWPIIRIEVRIINKEIGKKQVEVEEITPRRKVQEVLEEKHITKYLHFIWDIEQKIISHLDFAIQIYDSPSYEYRLDNSWSNNTSARQSTRRKLLRIDDALDYKEGIGLISDLFLYNDLIHQFFAGE